MGSKSHRPQKPYNSKDSPTRDDKNRVSLLQICTRLITYFVFVAFTEKAVEVVLNVSQPFSVQQYDLM